MLPFYGQLQIINTKPVSWASLVVQWLRLHASTERGMDVIPSQRTKIPHTARPETTHTQKQNPTSQIVSRYNPICKKSILLFKTILGVNYSSIILLLVATSVDRRNKSICLKQIYCSSLSNRDSQETKQKRSKNERHVLLNVFYTCFLYLLDLFTKAQWIAFISLKPPNI